MAMATTKRKTVLQCIDDGQPPATSQCLEDELAPVQAKLRGVLALLDSARQDEPDEDLEAATWIVLDIMDGLQRVSKAEVRHG